MTRLDKILKINRRPVEVLPTKNYTEIGLYSFGKGIFHKSPRNGIEVGNKKLFKIKKDDFIFQITFAWEGAIAIASKDENNMYGSSRFPTFIVDQNLCLPEFLLYYFRTKEGLEKIKKISPGSAGRNRVLSVKRFNEIDIFLPSVPEQTKIVELIRNSLNECRDSYAHVLEIPELIQKLKQSVLDNALSGNLTSKWRTNNNDFLSAYEFLKDLKTKREETYKNNHAKWKSKKISKKPAKLHELTFEHHPHNTTWARAKLENLIYVEGRVGWKGLTSDEYQDDGPLLLSVYNMNYGEYVNFDGANHISEDRYTESPEIQLQNDDILLVKDGSGIGKLAMVKKIKHKSTVNGSILVIRSLESMLPKFLFYFLLGPELQSVAKNRIRKGSTPHLFKRDMKTFWISIPPKEEQQEIIDIIESLIQIIYDGENGYKLIESELKNLPKSILSYSIPLKKIT